jgi:hypothetical protein
MRCIKQLIVKKTERYGYKRAALQEREAEESCGLDLLQQKQQRKAKTRIHSPENRQKRTSRIDEDMERLKNAGIDSSIIEQYFTMKLIKYKTLCEISQLRKGDGRYDTDMMSRYLESFI